MAKRFTETEKWRDPWFRKLSAGAKLAFLYLLDNCDACGVWTGDKELADFSIGMAIPWDRVSKDFGDRLEVLPDGKWFVSKFVEFQYGKLSKDCKPHLAVIRLLEKHQIERVFKGYSKGINTLEDQDKEKDKENGSVEGLTVLQAISQSALAGIPEDFARYVHDDWHSREGKDGAGVKCDFIRHAKKRWNREGQEWQAGKHKGNGNGKKKEPESRLI